jgi:hypothetical protein
MYRPPRRAPLRRHGHDAYPKNPGLVVQDNPLADICNTRNVEWVMTRGRLHRAEALRDAAQGTVGPEGAAEADAFKPEASR